ncbi:MAG TPA: sigma-54 dependent transcriptional regulator [Terriglobales bacterium]|nr:sigma-54 dependent transcriptional regulator [Terriglobales bacterium]
MSTQPSILVVDDEPSMLRYMQTLLEMDQYRVETATNGMDAIRRVEQNPAPDVILLDLLMPHMDGLQTLERFRQIKPSAKVVMLSCVSDTRKVVEAIRLGAQDYLTKPFHKADLDSVLKRLLKPEAGRQPAAEAMTGEVEELGEDLYFVAASPAMRKIRAQIGLVASVDIPVLLLGESGTGKEILARLIHKMSPRAHRSFLKVNCAALPADLLESELFGYEPGAFTGADRSKPGKFELCNKGTFLLDEVGEMPPTLQAKLLHVLQDQQFSRLGGRSTIRVDVRVLAATNIDIQQAINERRFREDLYYRLNAFTLRIPPLRERKEEIPLLLKHMMTRIAENYATPPLAYSPALLEACQRYEWPGNLRELGNFVKRYLVLRDEGLMIAELRSGKTDMGASQNEAPAATGQRPGGLKSLVRSLKDQAEEEAIRRTLDQTNWNRKTAAMMLNISYKALLYKIRQYGIEAPKNSRLRPGKPLV